jgi:hypothetical protein
MEPASLHLSNLAPLNPAGKPLSWLARDLEAEPPAGGGESGSIAGKGSCSSDLPYYIIPVRCPLTEPRPGPLGRSPVWLDIATACHLC